MPSDNLIKKIQDQFSGRKSLEKLDENDLRNKEKKAIQNAIDKVALEKAKAEEDIKKEEEKRKATEEKFQKKEEEARLKIHQENEQEDISIQKRWAKVNQVFNLADEYIKQSDLELESFFQRNKDGKRRQLSKYDSLLAELRMACVMAKLDFERFKDKNFSDLIILEIQIKSINELSVKIKEIDPEFESLYDRILRMDALVRRKKEIIAKNKELIKKNKYEIADPRKIDFEAEINDPREHTTFNPEMMDIDLENYPPEKVKLVEFPESVKGKSMAQIAKYFIDKYGATHHIPGIEAQDFLRKWLQQQPNPLSISNIYLLGSVVIFTLYETKDKKDKMVTFRGLTHNPYGNGPNHQFEIMGGRLSAVFNYHGDGLSSLRVVLLEK